MFHSIVLHCNVYLLYCFVIAFHCILFELQFVLLDVVLHFILLFPTVLYFNVLSGIECYFLLHCVLFRLSMLYYFHPIMLNFTLAKLFLLCYLIMYPIMLLYIPLN